MANRHGLIAGATGTGKTVTLQTLAERFSAIGVPVFMADVKGDLAGMAAAGGGNAKVAERVKSLGLEGFEYRADAGRRSGTSSARPGHPVRSTVSEMGPLLLARILDLNDTQAGVLAAVFKIADDQGLLLLDLKDLRAMLQFAGDNAAQFRTQYGNISTASVGAIQRGLLTLESQGGDKFFGEPALDLDDLMQTDGRPRRGQHPRGRQAARRARASTRPCCCGCSRSSSRTCPRWAIRRSPSSCSSSTRRTCSSTTRPRSCSSASSRSCAWCAPRASACTSSRRIRSTCRRPCWASSATACSTRCAPSRRATRQAVKAAATTFRANPKVNVEKAITELARGRGAGIVPRREGPPAAGRARVRRSAGLAPGPAHAPRSAAR